jgi:hypothetical protein
LQPACLPATPENRLLVETCYSYFSDTEQPEHGNVRHPRVFSSLNTLNQNFAPTAKLSLVDDR